MNENNEQNGGLFSDEYEAPKRENPYLKKNRDKAKAEKTKAKKEKPAEVESPYVAVEDKPLYPEDQATPAPAEGEGYVRKRTFSDWMFEHVKLIATIATILVVLSLVLITDVVGIVERIITQTQQADKEEITLTYVKGLSEMSQPISWQNLDKFRRDETKATDSVTWMLKVEGTDYELWVSGVSTEKPPVYVYLFDMKTGDRLVLGEEDFDAFIESHSK
ncbi:MAG: hypothetical protein IJ363_03265 [Clostridia bacterium]|nr:hypothetical protein [Clostridia bacterium]